MICCAEHHTLKFSSIAAKKAVLPSREALPPIDTTHNALVKVMHIMKRPN
jgi:hypothetical protein